MNLKKHLTAKPNELRLSYTEPNVREQMASKLVAWFPAQPREYVILCIGTDRSTGDAFGPLVGTLLTKLKPKHLTIYGTLDQPVHATNLMDHVAIIRANHKDPFIIAVDASLGKTYDVGSLLSGVGPIKPGAALSKPLPDIGDLHITGVVNVGGFMAYAVLQNTRLSIVMGMAKQVTRILETIDQQLTYQHRQPAILSHKPVRFSSIDA